MAVNTTASSLCTTASQALCRRSLGPRSKAQETRYAVLIARRLREGAGIGFWDLQCARGIWISLLSFRRAGPPFPFWDSGTIPTEAAPSLRFCNGGDSESG